MQSLRCLRRHLIVCLFLSEGVFTRLLPFQQGTFFLVLRDVTSLHRVLICNRSHCSRTVKRLYKFSNVYRYLHIYIYIYIFLNIDIFRDF